MKPHTALTLAVVAVLVVLGGWFFGTRTSGTESDTLARGQLAFPDLPARLQQAAHIDIEHQGKTITLDRRGDVWGLKDRFDYPVQTTKVHDLLVGLAELRLDERRTADPAEFGRLGLDDPAAATAGSSLVRVVDQGDKPIAALIVGHSRGGQQGGTPDQVFVRRPGQDQTWLADAKLQIDTDPGLWLDRSIVNIDHSTIATVTATRGNQQLELARAGEKFEMKAPADHPKLDDGKLEEVSRALEFLIFEDVKPAAQIPGQKLGEGVFTTTDGLKLTVDVNQAGQEIWGRFAAAGTGDGKARADQLNGKLGAWAYELGGWKEKTLVPAMDDLKAATPATAPATAAPSK
jgi:hypothetical protein